MWTPEHSVLLSQILDNVTGTQDIIEIRKDFCRLIDCINSTDFGYNEYFTGSQAEGLVLPGSDVDFMRDAHDFVHGMQVIEQDQAVPQQHRKHLFVMVTDNVQPAFAMLRIISIINPPGHPCIIDSLQPFDGSYFLSSYLMAHRHFSLCHHENVRMQGPSIEHTKTFGDDRDIVYTVHCSFWPSVASEWVNRTRLHNWPETVVIDRIVSFGFHLVPIGFPRSPRSMMEWRISFSIAERHLAWSFNHTQVQMYAVLKLILKEFIKQNCSATNYVLCSYFIKTFLFWKFEETEKSFWQIENFRDCLRYLLGEFHKVLQCGILRHYFIPSFNLLEVKMTRDAQNELLQLYDLAIQYDIRILYQCKTLQNVWGIFVGKLNNLGTVQASVSPCICLACNFKKCSVLMNTRIMMYHLTKQIDRRLFSPNSNTVRIISVINTCFERATTPLASLFLRRCLFMHNIRTCTKPLKSISNKCCYKACRFFNKFSVDAATGKLWTAILFYINGQYKITLLMINKLLSSVPPYALYISKGQVVSKMDTQKFYVKMFLKTRLSYFKISKIAWLFDFCVPQYITSIMPSAIQMELMYSPDKNNEAIEISPFTVAYYLQFLCFQGLRQYDNRDRALRQLVEVVDNPEQYGHISILHHACNIAGHCLRSVGQTARAREMFLKSCQVKMSVDGEQGNENNSARYYLQS